MKKLYQIYLRCLSLLTVSILLTTMCFAVEDMWTVAHRFMVDIYTHIVGISSLLAGLMSAVAIISAKLSNNQHEPGSNASGSPRPSSMASALLLLILHLCFRVIHFDIFGENILMKKRKCDTLTICL